MKEYKTFEDWWTEVENYSSRDERAMSECGPHVYHWVKTAWELGKKSNE